MKLKPLTRSLACLAWVTFLALAGVFGQSANLRPPAVPLVTHDPYFSIWSPADKLTDADTMHWTGKPHRLTSLVRIDGKAFRLMGKEPASVLALPQTGLEVTPTRTICSFEGQGVRLTLTFMTPALPDDLEVLSRPVTYATWEALATDGEDHEVSVFFEAAPEITVNHRGQAVKTEFLDLTGFSVLAVGAADQAILRKKGDDLRIDWGRFYLVGKDIEGDTRIYERKQLAMIIGPDAGRYREAWAKGTIMPSRPRQNTFSTNDAIVPFSPPTFAPDDLPVRLAIDLQLGKCGKAPVSRWLMLAYNDEYSIKYFRQNLRPYWRRNGDDAVALLKKAAADYESLKARCEKFDAELMADLRKVGGEKYAQLCALAYRQTFAGNKIVADANGQPLMFPKENFSNGCIGTVDVLFPQAPFFLVFSPALTKAMLVPILDYAASPRWPYDYAPHDLGTYPHAMGQVYGMRGKDGDRMPVEESGNMLIILAALAKHEGNADLPKKYWPMLTKWTDYLVKEGLDPANQLCSADMFGRLPRNANLALKAIIGIGAFGQLSELAGKPEEAKKYLAIARDYAAKWQELAKGEGHTILAYGQPNTWAMKHNLIWDRVLGLNLFPQSIGDAEIAWYLKVQKKYGLPVDNRTDTSLIDWALWSIAPARNDADFQALLEPIWRYANETPSRVPLSDWFVTTDAKKKGFQARPVVGGIFIKMLSDAATWQTWAKRGANTIGPWAPIPIGGEAKEVVPTAQTDAPRWRYTSERPATNWFMPDFKDTSWKEGPAGFGTRGTPGAIIGTEWRTTNIWLRREFTLPDRSLKNPRLSLIYDEDPEVYLNGVLAAKLTGWTGDYEEADIAPAARATLKPGKNLLAVRASQTYGGQSIDVGIVEDGDRMAENPSLKRWSPERAWQWYTNQPWLCGFNYVPANSISYTEMWMGYAFDEKSMDRELALAQDIGFNCLRVVLPFVVWEAEPAAFKQRFEAFLALCAKRGLKVMPCFFDDCVFGPIADPVFGKQPEVVAGWYANGCTPSPGHKRVRDSQAHPALERYVKDVMAAHRSDARILCWDLYNEPSNSGLGNASLPLLKSAFRWAREIDPVQPITSGLWGGSAQVAAFLRSASDIITFHNYRSAAELRQEITNLKQLGRPLICTEWLNRPRSSLVETCLPVFRDERVGALHWGLVNGKTQTHLPWGHKPGDTDPKIWQHDLFRADLAPYDPKELTLFRNLTHQKSAASAVKTASNDKLPGLRKLMDTPLRDTSICRGPDGWYLTGTVEPFWGFNAGIKVWKSPDLTNWTALGWVWKYGGSSWHKPYFEKQKPLWAPEIHFLKGTFWLTYSLPGWDGTGKTSGCGLLKSVSGQAEGPYVDMQPDARLGDEIDASLFEDDDGSVYFLWHSGKIARMKPDMSGLAEPYRWLKTTTSDPNPKHHSGLCAGIFGKGSFDHVGYEGMFLFKANGRYYLCCAEHFDGRYSCTVANSTNLLGPYGERYEALPHAGHNVLFKDDKGQWWSSYFGSDGKAPWQERPGILPVRFDANGRLMPVESHPVNP